MTDGIFSSQKQHGVLCKEDVAMKENKCLEVFNTMEKMAKYLDEQGYSFVITAVPVSLTQNEEKFIVSCTNHKSES